MNRLSWIRNLIRISEKTRIGRGLDRTIGSKAVDVAPPTTLIRTTMTTTTTMMSVAVDRTSFDEDNDGDNLIIIKNNNLNSNEAHPRAAQPETTLSSHQLNRWALTDQLKSCWDSLLGTKFLQQEIGSAATLPLTVCTPAPECANLNLG